MDYVVLQSSSFDQNSFTNGFYSKSQFLKKAEVRTFIKWPNPTEVDYLWKIIIQFQFLILFQPFRITYTHTWSLKFIHHCDLQIRLHRFEKMDTGKLFFSCTEILTKKVFLQIAVFKIITLYIEIENQIAKSKFQYRIGFFLHVMWLIMRFSSIFSTSCRKITLYQIWSNQNRG